jgi:hypothetical protein
VTVPVSNTSPLTNLAAIGQFDLLRQLYGGLLIAEAVWAELNADGRTWPGRAEVARRRLDRAASGGQSSPGDGLARTARSGRGGKTSPWPWNVRRPSC